MSGLDNLISRIQAESDTKAREVIEEANREADAIIDNETSRGNKEKSEIIAAAKTEAVRQKEQIMTQKRIAIRDAKLRAKQEVFDKVLTMAAAKLKDMSQDDYKKFLHDYLSEMQLDGGEEIVLPVKYQDIDLQEICNSLHVAGLAKHQGSRKIDSGFAVIKGGMEYNNTFEALFDFYRDDLEKIISAVLF